MAVRGSARAEAGREKRALRKGHVPQPARVAILGCGPVGAALLVGLVGSRRFPGRLRLWSRQRTRAARLVRSLGPRARARVELLEGPLEALAGSDLVVLAVSDDALAPLALRLARGAPASGRARTRVVHTNGFLDASILEPLRRRGFAVGRLHPLVPLSRRGGSLHAAPFALEGDRSAVRSALALVWALEGVPLHLSPRRGAAAGYHAGAALLGGGIVALMHLAERAMAGAVRRRSSLRDALGRFAAANVRNASALGPAQALTGPLARGSVALVRGHLEALRAVPGARAAYQTLGAVMLELAAGRGSLDAATQKRLRGVLKGRSSGKG